MEKIIHKFGHNNAATVWKDLSGNGNDGVAKGSNISWKDDSCTLNGTNAIEVSKDIGNILGDSYTFEIIYKNVEAEGQRGALMGNHNATDTQPFVNIEFYTNNMLRFVSGLAPSDYPNFDVGLKRNVIQSNANIISIIDSQNANYTVYQDGIKKLNNYKIIYKKDIAKQITKTLFGNDYRMNSEIGFVGEIYAIRIYNRNLSEREIEQNHEIDKIRFSI